MTARLRPVGFFLVTEAVNLCPEEQSTGELRLSCGDAVRLAQTSPSVAAAINWIKGERLAGNELRPRRRKSPQPPTTFPLAMPRLPTRLSPTAALTQIARLDAAAAKAFRAVASAGCAVTLWGDAEWGQRDDAPTGDGFVAIACGGYHSVALRDDGTVVTWGSNSLRQRDDAPAGDGFVAIACGYCRSVGLRNDRTVVTY
eukprot:CAMPEP_0118916738 /NCGR_PEP_ID=MMETSP1166-20130328/16667_1 /TAXON_ID=1104430 /ORGANISM="Chrysoreinhardia sp, Strain CCMP3193" /LENGTH=199 /DNA_ID=CAMNT_0006856651 /DNA_START=100 /DNA_END=699 /DNA_ORIENTATION=+